MSRELALCLAKYGVIIILGICTANWAWNYVHPKDTSPGIPYTIDTLYFQTIEDIVVHMPDGKTHPLVSDGVNTYIQCRVHGGYTYIPFQFDTSEMKIRAIYNDSTKIQ